MTWPTQNRADSLQVDYHNIRRMVGQYLDFGYNHAEWDDELDQAVQEVIDEGIRLFYSPPALQPPYAQTLGIAHEWTFMRPTWHFETSDGERRLPLPPNFDRPIGKISFRDTDNNYYGPISFASPTRLQMLENRTDYTAPPEIAAIEPRECDGDAPQEFDLVLHPTPDSNYKLQLQYQAYPRRLSEEHPYPLGGQQFSAIAMAACLAAAEMRKKGQQGPMYQVFTQRLTAGILKDYERGAQVLGYNGNAGSEVHGRASARMGGMIFYGDVTFDGATYDG